MVSKGEKGMQTVAMAMNADLETIKGAIAAKFDTATYTSWIAPLTFDIENDTLVLGAQNQFSLLTVYTLVRCHLLHRHLAWH